MTTTLNINECDHLVNVDVDSRRLASRRQCCLRGDGPADPQAADRAGASAGSAVSDAGGSQRMDAAMTAQELGLDGFAEIAERAGLKLHDDELELMRKGYLGLLALLEGLPEIEDVFVEPATVFAPISDDAHGVR